MDKSKSGQQKDFSNSTQGNPGNRDEQERNPTVRDQDSREQGSDAAKDLKRDPQNGQQQGNRETGKRSQ